jgi:peptidoglycan biosynthesis protein MviN/MurJ (putative lipid II flippase)
MLFAAARRRNGSLGLSRCAAPLAKTLAGCAAMAAAIFAARHFAAPLRTALPERIGAAAHLAVLVAAGGAAYGAFAFVFARDLLGRRFRRAGRR